MKNDCPENKLIHQREGTTQKGRYKTMLNPDKIKLMGFDVKDWMTFAQKFSKHVRFFDDDTIANENWEPFHNATEKIKKTIESYDDGEITPQLALFVCFLKLLNESKASFNKITKKHLDFYYKEALQLKEKEAQPDHVFVLFELAKNSSEQLLKENTTLNAGKDSKGNVLNYELTEEIVINKAKIAALKNSYANANGWYSSEIANSGDGIGGAIENDSKSWSPFGNPTRPLASKGCAIASPSFKLSEGVRTITLIFYFENIDERYKKYDLKKFLNIQHTGAKEWVDISSTLDTPIINDKTLTVVIPLNADNEAIVGYDKKIHKGHYNTKHPVLKILFKTEFSGPNKDADAKNSHDFYMHLAEQTVSNIEINTTSTYSKNMTVKNDLGVIDLENPFYPFGTQARKNAKFKIGAEEWVGKNIHKVSLSLTWKELPEDFQKHYEHYKKELLELNSTIDFSTTPPIDQYTSFVTKSEGKERFTASLSYIQEDNFTVEKEPLFLEGENKSFTNFLPSDISYSPKSSDPYFIQLSLDNNFLHDVYPKIHTYLAMWKLPLPNIPYTPFAENLEVEITTKDQLTNTNSIIELYHEHPFGIQKGLVESNGDIKLFSKPGSQGQLFIGIDDFKEDQNVQLLFQLEEGSENPKSITKNGLAKVSWEYLKDNQWENLNSDFLRKDQTDHFLKTGLVQFTVPKDLGNNTLFSENYFWVKATIDKPFDTVSKFINIHTQAVKVVFKNQKNTLEHLHNGLAIESISKLKQRLSSLKKIEQPYASFNGIPKENDLGFYRRISERLRHKNKAISVWDYEHLALEKFNFLHKVKCLNHSTVTNLNQPGNVLLVAVPDIKNQNVYDVFQPQLSQSKLNAVKNYINKLNTLHVSAAVISPDYKPVKVTLKVAFQIGLDANYYAQKLRHDIAHYLAPWAYDKNQPISFGNSLFASEVIYYIEKLSYVDFIQDFNMRLNNDKASKKEIIPPDQISILTSVKADNHEITAITSSLCQV